MAGSGWICPRDAVWIFQEEIEALAEKGGVQSESAQAQAVVVGSFHFHFTSVFRWQFTVCKAACLAQLIQSQLKRIPRELLSCSFTDEAAEGMGDPGLLLFLCPVYSRSQQLGRDGGMKEGGCNGCSREVSGVNSRSSTFLFSSTINRYQPSICLVPGTKQGSVQTQWWVHGLCALGWFGCLEYL